MSSQPPLRPLLRTTLSSPNTSSGPNDLPTTASSLAPSPSASSSHISIQTPPAPDRTHSSSTLNFGALGALNMNMNAHPERERNKRHSHGALSPAEIHSAMHREGSGHGSSPGGSGVGFPRTNTQGSAGEGRYRRKVGFEAFEAGPETLFAFTCQAKSDGYKRSRNTRVFAVAVSPDESGEDALEWLMSELVEDGDEVVAIRVLELDEGERHDPTALSDFREEAHGILRTMLEKNDEAENRKISVIVEMVAGPVPDMLLKMIALYRPDSLIVGTRGSRSRLQSFGRALGAPGMGSVSRYAVSHSPVPVIVVRPERKVKKHLAKRQNDPKRGHYAQIVGPNGLELSRSRSRGSIGGMSDKE